MNHSRVFTRTELWERVLEHAHDYDTKPVEMSIRRLRTTLANLSRFESFTTSLIPSAAEVKFLVRRALNSQG